MALANLTFYDYPYLMSIDKQLSYGQWVILTPFVPQSGLLCV